MKYDEMLKLCDQVDNDVKIVRAIHITVNDFIGFDKDYNAMFRDLDNLESVQHIYNTLKATANRVDDSREKEDAILFYFDDFEVHWSLASDKFI